MSFRFVTALAAPLSAGLACAASTPERGVLVDLVAVGDSAQVEALKGSDGADWWLEVGEVLLLAGDVEALPASVPPHLLLRDVDNLRADRLALRPRGCIDHRQALAPEDLLLVSDTFELVNQPVSFAPAGLTAGRINPHLGAPEFVGIERNSVIARLHRFDLEQGPPAADPGIAHIASKVDADRWFETVTALAGWDRSSYSPTLPAARQWIGAQFAEAGLSVSEPVFTVPFATPAPLANVIGRIEGTTTPDEWVIIGAHYDSRNATLSSPSPSPGADDNASGCAGVIEAARVLARYRPARSVLFMCYSGEEQGLYGSQGHVETLAASGDLGKIQAMLNMDMIGWVSGPPPGVLACTRSAQATGAAELLATLSDAFATYAPVLQVTTSTSTAGCCCSDHAPYLQAGRPATHSIHRGGTTYPHYHKETDTPSNLGPHARDVGGAIVRGNIAALALLAGYDLLFAGDFED